MNHLFTLTTDGDLFNRDGIKITRFPDTLDIGPWLLDFRDAYGREIEGEIIKWDDLVAWEAAVAARALEAAAA